MVTKTSIFAEDVLTFEAWPLHLWDLRHLPECLQFHDALLIIKRSRLKQRLQEACGKCNGVIAYMADKHTPAVNEYYLY